MTGPRAAPWPGLIALLVALTLWRIAIAWGLPVTLDEAYYFDWARHLAWGYFDHPPGVALLGLGTWLAPASALAARAGALVAATLTLVVLVALYRRAGLRDGRDLTLALVLAVASLAALAGAVTTTPDSVLALCWALALHEALAALQGTRWRWLTAGLATGLGILGKYMMVLIGPVFLWAILAADPRALRTPWPYLGGLLALAVLIPHLWWGMEHDWVSVRFQLGHGFATETGVLVESPLPPPAVTPLPAAVPQGPPGLAERFERVLAYAGIQLGLWGLLLVPVVLSLMARRGRAIPSPTLEPAARALLIAATAFPLLFFGLVAALGEVEPNWPAMYLLAAAPLLAIPLRRVRGWVLAAAAGNLLALTLYVAHAATALLPLPSGMERILRETHGYEALAERVAGLDGPIFADRYQIAAMLRFYQPGLEVHQWPGITRPSEYLRGTLGRPPSLDRLRLDGFWLVTRKAAPRIPGFTVLYDQLVYDCKVEGLVQGPGGSCPEPVHVWRLVRYR